jgi:hypothetical protein
MRLVTVEPVVSGPAIIEPLTLETRVGHRVHREKHGAHREMRQEITRLHYHPAGEFKFEDHPSISISLCTPSELGELRVEIERRNLDHGRIGLREMGATHLVVTDA